VLRRSLRGMGVYGEWRVSEPRRMTLVLRKKTERAAMLKLLGELKSRAGRMHQGEWRMKEYTRVGPQLSPLSPLKPELIALIAIEVELTVSLVLVCLA
jgi:hypothetical protein